MPRPPIDLARKIKDIPQHVEPLPGEARAPILHYRLTSSTTSATLAYVEDAFDQGSRYNAVVGRHLSRLYGMAMIGLIENFERFLKEAASECVDCVAPHTLDDRFDGFKTKASGVAAHFGAGSIGKYLCEPETWLSCAAINDRFRDVLSDPFEPGNFYLFPTPKQLPKEAWRSKTMAIVWQLRHSVVHNVGVITISDAAKLRILAQEEVVGPRLLVLTRDDIRYLKRFLDETANWCNTRIATRLAELLSTLHGQSPGLLGPQEYANRLASAFRTAVSVAGVTGLVPAD